MRSGAVTAILVLSTAAVADESLNGPPRPLSDEDAKAGKPLYLRECSACHGDRGDGAGPAAAFLDPKPRNFTKRIFKLRTTESGQQPTTADLLGTVERGIPGSAMPAFRFLPEEERRRIVAYVLRLADLADDPEPKPIADPGVPPTPTPASLTRGKAVYAEMGCASCHGTGGRGDGDSAKDLKDDDGNHIPVRDFTGGQFRGGGDRIDLYYRFVTGMDGSPMPSFAQSIDGADRWALVDYVMSLKVVPPAVPLPKDPIKAGRMVTAKYSCRGCHVLDDGKGGEVGPDLRVSGQKLGSDWVRTFLADPRGYGKIYPWRVWRMPHLGLEGEEVQVLARYLAAMGKRADGPAKTPDVATFPAARIEEGKSLFTLRCTECHALGKVIETPLAKQQGPDLIRVAGRVDYDWAKKWILDPKKIDPKTKMTVPGITPDQIDSVRMFVWKSAVDANSER